VKREVNKFWQFKNAGESGNTDPELLIYGPIADQESWWADVNTPKNFANDLKALGSIGNLTVRINSKGGDVFAATAIYTMLKDHPANITVKIDGIAASAATIIAMAGDTIKAPANAQVMIHDPLLVLYGYYNPSDLEKMAEVLGKVKASILSAYAIKTKRDKAELAEMMKKETWMTAEEAKTEGFVDEIMFEEVVDSSITNDGRFMIVNSICHDLSQFKTRPVPQRNKDPLNVTPVVFGAGKEPLTKKTKESENSLEIKTIDALRNAYPDLLNEAINAAVDIAVKAERTRIQSIDDIAANIDPKLVNKAKYEEPVTAEALAFQALKADASKGMKYVATREKEIENSGAEDVDAGTGDDGAQAEAAAMDAIAASANKNRGGKSK
jgi:ATP-dependent protease ClpP protease subunit